MAKQAVRKELTRLDYVKRGLVAVMAVALLLGLVWLRGSGTFGGPEHISAQVADAGGSLAPGGDVKLRGVIIGKVDEIGRGSEGTVLVRISVTKDRLDMIPSNVVARILPATVFGTTFVDLVPDGPMSSTSLESGAVIPADKTQGTLELQQALDDIDALVKAVGPAELASAIGSAAQALDGRGEQLGNLVDRLDGYLGKLNPKMPTLRTDVQKLAANLAVFEDVSPDLLKATNDALVTMRTVVTQKAQIARLISGGTALAVDSRQFLGKNEKQLMRFLDNSVALLDAVYDNRHAAVTQAFATNRSLAAKLSGIMNHSFLDTIVEVDLDVPDPYTTADCPRYGSAAGPNCSGLGRAGTGAMYAQAPEGGSR